MAYIGDDVNDIKVMKNVRLVACPNNAVQEVKEIANIVCEKNGGEGAVREFCEYLIKSKSEITTHTRGRIIHFLIYFGDETIKEGGELGISEHKSLDSYLQYKQYPDKSNLEKIEYIKPKNNVGIFILSQNNSYHKGCSTKGLRRFIYAGYTNKSGNAWKTKDWSANKNFSQRLQDEYK